MTRALVQQMLEALNYMLVTPEHKVDNSIPYKAVDAARAYLEAPDEPVGEVVAIDSSEENDPVAIVELHQDVALGAMLFPHPAPEVKQEPSKFHILAITTAYEQGVGKGHQAFKRGNDIENPYVQQSDCAEAWFLGYKEGKVQAKDSFSYTHPTPQPEPVNQVLLEALKVMLRDYTAVHDIGDLEMQPAIYQARAAIAAAEQHKPVITDPATIRAAFEDDDFQGAPV